MPYKILTLLIFIILFPALIAGSTVLLLKSGLIDSSVHTTKSDINSTETQNTGLENHSDQKRVSDVLEYPKYYFKGKIDGKLQVWLILNGYLNPFQDSTLESGQILIEGENAIEDIYGTFPNPKTCKNDCAFSLEIPYYGGGDGPKLPKTASNPVFNGSWQQKDKQTPLDEIQSLVGFYTPLDSKQKLKFELNRSVEFEIADYLTKYNFDKSLYIKGNGCFGVGRKLFEGDCRLFDSKSQLEISTLIDCKKDDAICFSAVEFGKNINQKQYILAFEDHSCLNVLTIFTFDIKSRKMEKSRDFGYEHCAAEGTKEYIQEQISNKPYNEAMNKYSIPKS